jgi:transmembrane sensor
VAEKDTPMTDASGASAVEHEAQQWLVRLTSGDATAADARALKAWCERSPAHARAFAEANLLWDQLDEAARRPASAHRTLPSRRWFLGGAIAASVVGAGYLVVRPPMELWPSPQEFAADYRTRTAERREIPIANGVTIELNTRSSLNVSPSAARQIELIAGEAAISVSPQQAGPLTVRAAGGVVQASDAQFNLRCEAGRSVVTCHHGTLAVDYAGTSVELAAGRQIAYADGTLTAPVSVDAAAVMAWRDGQLVFRQTPLADVVGEVNRYRNGRIVLLNEALGRRPVNARIPIARVDDLIALVREAYGAKVTALPGAIVVLS